jgi:hypothetical protein
MRFSSYGLRQAIWDTEMDGNSTQELKLIMESYITEDLNTAPFKDIFKLYFENDIN